jgi:hypothetical protein
VLAGYPRLAAFLTNLYMLGVRLWPSLFAFQIIVEAEAVEDPLEQLRQLEIMNPEYQEWTLLIASDEQGDM